MILKIICAGGFITLPTYRNHQKERCIRIMPRQRNMVCVERTTRKNREKSFRGYARYLALKEAMKPLF